MSKLISVATLSVALLGFPAQAQFVLSATPSQPAGTQWPTEEWPRGALDGRVDALTLSSEADALMDAELFDSQGRTHALLVVHRGEIVLERYDEGYSCDRIGHTMSIAKIAGSAIAGVMAAEGALDLHEPAALRRWGEPEDPRREITPYDILTMTSGLRWNDTALIGNDFLEFAFGSGIDDLAGYVASKPLDHAPGEYFYYSDGSLSLIGELLREHVSGGRAEVAAYLDEALFRPLGMDETEAEFDRHGVWYGSSGMRWSPCDLARLSLLYLRGGVWEGEQLLPEGWVELMRTPTEASLAEESVMQTVYGGGYGMASFIYDVDASATPIEIDAFGHLGFGGHVLWISPSRDLIVILYGSGAQAEEKHLRRLDTVRRIASLFPVLSSPE